MADQTVPRLDRATRGSGIVVRHEVEPIDGRNGFYRVRDTGTGSGKTYIVSLDTCTCPDHTYRSTICKHITATRAEHQALEAYDSDWDRASQQPRCPMCGCP